MIPGSEVAHRWEWRVFGSHLDQAHEILEQAGPTGEAQDTDEIYLVGPGETNIKVRFDLLDIKKLVEVHPSGLELWAPHSKSQFPMTSEQVDAVFESIEAKGPLTDREEHTLEQFLDELVAPLSGLEAVEVHKRRTRYSIDGCMAERAELTVNGRRTTTIAAESEDPTAVVAAVERLGLTGHVNTNYGLGLRCLIGMAPVRYGVIDIGTNSVKFHVGEQHPDGSWTRVVDRAEVTRLGEGLESGGEIQPEPLERTVRAVHGMVDEAKAQSALGIAAVGTAALRLAANSEVVTESIRARTGVSVEVVSGAEETRLAYLAAVAGVGLEDVDVVVFDTGGGSSQFTFGRGGEVDEQWSVDVGSVAFAERFGLAGAVDEGTIEEARHAIGEGLARLDDRPAPAALIGMGGTITNITAVSLALDPYDPDVVQGATVTLEEVERQIEMYRSLGQEDRGRVVGLQPNRAPVILAGALIVATIMRRLGRDSLVVSDRGLRHGLIRERFGFFETD